MATTPGAPGNVSAMQAAGAAATVTWTAPAGATGITGYTVTSSPGNKTATAGPSGTTATVTGLTLGMSYTFTVVATNAGGNGPASLASNAIVAADVPGAPTGVSAMAIAGAKATVTWTAAASNFNNITQYTVTSTPGNFTATSTASPATVSGLTAGQSYTFTVTATNGLGTGPGATSASIMVGSTPAAPTNVVATAVAGGKVNLSWTAPSGSVTQYTIMAAGIANQTTVGTTLTISGLTNGTTYTFSVRADNAIGMGGTGTASPVVAGDVPGTPTVSATTGPGLQAKVTWTAPASNGYMITGYTLTSSPAGVNLSLGGSTTMQTVLQLAQNTAYTFSVKATNALGTGLAGSSSPVTPTCSPKTYVLDALDTATVEYGTAAYSTMDFLLAARTSSGFDTTGWTRFSLSTVSSYAVVTGAKLLILWEGTSGSPMLQIDYSSADGWSRAQNPTAANVPRTATVSNPFTPIAVMNYQTITLTTGTHDFTTDLAASDLNLTLGVSITPSTTGNTQAFYAGTDMGSGSIPHLSLTTCE